MHVWLHPLHMHAIFFPCMVTHIRHCCHSVPWQIQLICTDVPLIHHSVKPHVNTSLLAHADLNVDCRQSFVWENYEFSLIMCILDPCRWPWHAKLGYSVSLLVQMLTFTTALPSLCFSDHRDSGLTDWQKSSRSINLLSRLSVNGDKMHAGHIHTCHVDFQGIAVECTGSSDNTHTHCWWTLAEGFEVQHPKLVSYCTQRKIIENYWEWNLCWLAHNLHPYDYIILSEWKRWFIKPVNTTTRRLWRWIGMHEALLITFFIID